MKRIKNPDQLSSRPWLSYFYKYLFDFIVVFAGVFLAFLLSEYKENKRSEQKRQEIYRAIYEELNEFVEDGRIENEKGFINFFRKLDHQSDSLIAIKKPPIKMNIYGDYWKTPIINSLVLNGQLKDIDIETFKKVTRFHTVHQNFLANINDYNNFYDKYITAEYDLGIDHFYSSQADGEVKLRPKYLYLDDAMEGIAEFAALLVKVAEEMAQEIKDKHLRNDQ